MSIEHRSIQNIAIATFVGCVSLLGIAGPAAADETCLSPYMAALVHE